MTHRSLAALLTLPALVALGCAAPDDALPLAQGNDDGGGDGAPSKSDSGADGTSDGGADTSLDAPADAPPDNGNDAKVDVAADVPTDTPLVCPPADAGTPPSCTPNATETAACACNTGIKNRTCDANGTWGAWSACTGSPSLCQPCERQTVPCGFCGTREQTCDESCNWSTAAACVGSQACAPNTYKSDATGCTGGQVQLQKCDSTCNWGAPSACQDPPGWVAMPKGPLTARESASAVFTGTELIVWGGEDGYDPTNTGARFDVTTQTWSSMATPDGTLPDAGAPDAGDLDATAEDAGDLDATGQDAGEIDAAGQDAGDLDAGDDADLDGATETSPPPPITLTPRSYHSTIWTGSEMIVWGGYDGSSYTVLDDGGRYEPSTDSWKLVSNAGAPIPRQRHTAVWTGTEMIVWGGEDDQYVERNDGRRYDPATDTWRSMAQTTLTGRSQHIAVWDDADHLMLVWGGVDDSYTSFGDGGRYDPTTDTWTPMATAPLGPRYAALAVWDDVDHDLIVWGGQDDMNGDQLDGARYHPATDTWTPIASVTATGFDSPAGATAVWGDGRMWIAGGMSSSTYSTSNLAVSYDPATDTWTALPNMSDARSNHASVYAGHLYVWGGAGNSSNLARGEFLRAP